MSDRAALEGDSRIRESGLPTFVIGNVRPTAERPTENPDRCSVHGDIPGHVSITGHLQTHHGLTYDEWKTLSDLAARESAPDEPLRDAIAEYMEAVAAYLDPDNQFTDSRLHHIEVAAIRVRAALATPAIEPGIDELDVRRVAEAIANVAKRHGIVQDPPVPLVLARIYGYSAAPAEMDAEIAREYAALATPAIEPGIDEELRLALREWLDNRDDDDATQAALITAASNWFELRATPLPTEGPE